MCLSIVNGCQQWRHNRFDLCRMQKWSVRVNWLPTYSYDTIKMMDLKAPFTDVALPQNRAKKYFLNSSNGAFFFPRIKFHLNWKRSHSLIQLIRIFGVIFIFLICVAYRISSRIHCCLRAHFNVNIYINYSNVHTNFFL